MNSDYTFQNQSLLEKALTHPSFANERGIESNQRLEFLGDSVLSLVVAEYIYATYQNFDEGKLTQLRAAMVCEKALAASARRMNLGPEIRLGKSEEVCHGREKASILSDTFEAVLGAIYLDGGLEQARAWVLKQLKGILEETTNQDFRNYKSELQIYYQKRDKGEDVVTYRLCDKKGPDHAATFWAEAVYRGEVIGRGMGKNRKTAEQQAAKVALEKL